MIGDQTKSVWDLAQARSLSEAAAIWPQVEVNPAWLLLALVLLGGLYVKFILHSPVDRREPRPGSTYLGNVRLGQNPKADGGGPLRTRLSEAPETVPDEARPKRLRR